MQFKHLVVALVEEHVRPHPVDLDSTALSQEKPASTPLVY